jgi:hypothetical protein
MWLLQKEVRKSHLPSTPLPRDRGQSAYFHGRLIARRGLTGTSLLNRDVVVVDGSLESIVVCAELNFD